MVGTEREGLGERGRAESSSGHGVCEKQQKCVRESARERERARASERARERYGQSDSNQGGCSHLRIPLPLALSCSPPIHLNPLAVLLLAHSAKALSLPSLFLPRTHRLTAAATLQPDHFLHSHTCLRALASPSCVYRHTHTYIFTFSLVHARARAHTHTHTPHTTSYGPSCRSTCP
jgi:hypothetical protein